MKDPLKGNPKEELPWRLEVASVEETCDPRFRTTWGHDWLGVYGFKV